MFSKEFIRNPSFLTGFLLLLLLAFFPSKALAAVTAFVAADKTGKHYEYDYQELLDDYVSCVLGGEAPLYRDYAVKKVVSFRDSLRGYICYQDILETYVASVINGTGFDVNEYTESGKTRAAELPPSLQSLNCETETGIIAGEEKLLLTPCREENPGSFLSLTSHREGPVKVLKGLRYEAEVEGPACLKYAWYVYRDGEHIRSCFYTDCNIFDYVPTEPGNYVIRAFAVTEDGTYEECSSDCLTVLPDLEIVKPDWNWRGPLVPFTNAIEKLVQHHMAHPTWDVYDVHNRHRNKTYVTGDGSIDNWYGIGYNYWIGFDGTIFEGRGIMEGGHAGPSWNWRSLGIGYQGHFDIQEMTDEQLASGAWLNAKLILEENLEIKDIVGHRDILSTSCPGANFRMEELKAETAKILAQVWDD
ncbi:MAG TPA: hypothetical protein GX697_01175 [Firmicutes bacterium]|nr:hypothetical protein [Bacillota bacterium]